MMSATPAAVWLAGTEKVSVGSQIDATGARRSLAKPSFSLVSRFEITALLSYSLPVAESVSTVKSGSAFLIFEESTTSSQASSSLTAPAAIALEQSITLPPPTARMKSIFLSLQTRTPARTLSMRGLGTTPSSSKISRPGRAAFT